MPGGRGRRWLRGGRRRRRVHSCRLAWPCGCLLSWAIGWSGVRGRERQEVVLGEVARLGPGLPEGLFEPARHVLGDVLVEGARRGPSGQDALDGEVLEGSERCGVSECTVEVGGVVALAQQQDLTSLMTPDPWRAEAHQTKKVGRALAHSLEGDVELIEIDGALSLGWPVESGGVELETLSAPSELVACDASQVGRVDEELTLGDA